jgi:hypothetical protein
MASSTRNHVVKRDIASGTILSRIATNSLLPPKYDALFYQLLDGLSFESLPAHRQMAAILFASTSCNIICKGDMRGVNTDADFQEKLVQFQNIDDLYSQWFKLFDKLNSTGAKEKTKDEEQVDIGERLQELLSQHDSRSNPSQ